MSPSRSQRLLAFARELQSAADFSQVLEIARVEVHETLGYDHAWIAVAEHEDATEVKLLHFSGPSEPLAWDHAATIPVTGDAMMEEIMRSDVPVVVEDAQTDPRTNKAIVKPLGNRTIINVPLRLLDKPFGCFGVGTFGDEGVRVPDAEQLDYLVGMTGVLSVAAGRIRFLAQQRLAAQEKQDLERRLAQAQRLESVGLLAGGVAHDFNNLLTVILASASLARREDQPADVQAELDAIEEAGTRGAQLTRQLLAVSRTQPLESRTVDVNARIGELTTMLRRLLPETIAIEHLSHTPHALVRGDPTQIDQVLMNLCINARDAMPHGGRLTLETELADIEQAYVAMHPRARPGRYVLITVTDTGTGMAPEVVDRIFEPFFTTKSERAGTGLGLAVAYGVVVQHGGMLHCYSEPGVGTTFRIYLPLQDQAETEPVVPRNQLEIGGSERILVAEDDPAIRAALERVLERAGYVATIVAHGDAACEAVDAAAYDLVLLDVVMPGRSCADTLAHIRKARPDARVLLSSGYTADTNVADLLRDGKTAFLRKPYDPPALLRAIRGALER